MSDTHFDYVIIGAGSAGSLLANRLSENPRYSVLRTKYGNEVSKVEESIGIDVMSILTLPLRREMEGRRFERVETGLAIADQDQDADREGFGRDAARWPDTGGAQLNRHW